MGGILEGEHVVDALQLTEVVLSGRQIGWEAGRASSVGRAVNDVGLPSEWLDQGTHPRTPTTRGLWAASRECAAIEPPSSELLAVAASEAVKARTDRTISPRAAQRLPAHPDVRDPVAGRTTEVEVDPTRGDSRTREL